MDKNGSIFFYAILQVVQYLRKTTRAIPTLWVKVFLIIRRGSTPPIVQLLFLVFSLLLDTAMREQSHNRQELILIYHIVVYYKKEILALK